MTHSAGLPQRLYKCCFLCKAKIIYVSPIDTADADDGHKSMRLKSSDDKVIEAALHYVFRCFDYDYDNEKVVYNCYNLAIEPTRRCFV
jgi:hypothetical protein